MGSWNPKQPFISGCFDWIIPNLYLGKLFTVGVKVLDALVFWGGEILKTGIFIICIYFSAI